LRSSQLVKEVFCATGNAGKAMEAVDLDLAENDIAGLLDFARKERIDLTVVGPEAPLVAGLVDAFDKEGLRVFGPSRQAAELEGSKVFAKDVMRSASIPTAESQVFNNADAAEAYVEGREETRLVVKADGLASGKGVTVCQSRAEALDAIRRIMRGREFGDAGARLVIEECLDGEEVSILALTDGETIIPLETSQDHKAAFDEDKGPNTGGMGAYSPAPQISPLMMDNIIGQILVPAVHAMKRRNRPFKGVLYAGLMMSYQGPKVLEFNVRFGDPEAQPLLMRLKSDLAPVLLALAEGRLSEIDALQWDKRPSVCVVMAAEGYPGDYPKGQVIRGLDEAGQVEGVKVFHAGTTLKNGQVVTNGGRVLGVTAIGDRLGDAKLRAYQAVKHIRWPGAWCRHDISDKARQYLRE
ncbi:MAG: phosphoribosylamine--glycine ligase, partial [Planctomycetaceae bacterium]